MCCCWRFNETLKFFFFTLRGQRQRGVSGSLRDESLS